MRIPIVCLAGLLCLGACGNEESPEAKAALAAEAKQTAYAECMAAADRQPSRAETVAAARKCLHLPDAPPPDTTLPPGAPPPSVSATAAPDTVGSVYTSLEQCTLVSTDEESESSVARCPGVARHQLIVSEGDLRMTIDVVTPDGRTHPLEYWSVITSGFSSLGKRAEWRMRGGQPIALIVRVNASEDPEDSSRLTSYLAVARITPGSVCVTDRIAPAANANEAARRAADASATRPCLKQAPGA